MRDCRRRGHRNRLRRGNRRSPLPPPPVHPSVRPSIPRSRRRATRGTRRLYPTIQILIQLRENDVVAPLSYVLASSSASLSSPPPQLPKAVAGRKSAAAAPAQRNLNLIMSLHVGASAHPHRRPCSISLSHRTESRMPPRFSPAGNRNGVASSAKGPKGHLIPTLIVDPLVGSGNL